jgi:type IV secretory pathway VirD2 relaxase
VTEEVMFMTATAHFASLRSELIVVERTAQPVFSNGRQISEEPGVYHRFRDHRTVVKGQGHIDFMRSRLRAPDAPEMWELDADDVPEITELLAELATADIDRVREIRANEEGTSRRQIILQTCDAVLQRAGVSPLRAGQQKATVTA